MSAFRVEFDTDNAAFGDENDPADVRAMVRAAEIVRILDDVSARIADGALSDVLRDVNGNVVGYFNVEARQKLGRSPR